MIPFEDEASLPLLFHLNSEPWLNAAAYQAPAGQMQFASLKSREAAIALPPPGSSPLMELIAARESTRRWSQQSLKLADAGDLLAAGYGVLGLKVWPDGRRVYQRPVPSAGGLYPLELYAICARVEGLESGLYHFQAREHSLELVNQRCELSALASDLMRQSFVTEAALLVLVTAVFRRTMKKYGPRGYRYVLFEAGHAVQNMCLRAAELGLASLCVGGFTDSRINALLKLDGRLEAAVYAVALGYQK